MFLALSCLQGRPMREAFLELAALADGVQLTPGNHPTPNFREHVEGRAHLVHHGFDFEKRSVAVWRGAELLVRDRSVHPPEAHECSWRDFAQAAERGLPVTLETMYPGYHLGSGDELEWAMDRGLPLAVDVSHLAIQREAKVLGHRALARVFDYERVAEIHVSRSVGTRDAHAPLTEDSFGLAWARARGAPIVLECYMHKLTDPERRRQIDLARGS